MNSRRAFLFTFLWSVAAFFAYRFEQRAWGSDSLETGSSASSALLLADSIREPNATIPPPYHSRFWETSTEPVRNIIHAITQTSDGVLWVGTAGGLAHFDGEQFAFQPFGENGRFDKAKINALCAGVDGSLWIGTAGDGAVQLHSGNWIEHPMPEGLDPNVLALQACNDGAVWMGTRKGMAVFQDGELTARNDRNDKTAGPEKFHYTEHVRSISQGTNGSLWIAAGDHLMGLLNGAAVSDFPLFQFNPTYFRSVCSRRDGSIWLGANSGLVRFQEGKFTHFAKHNGLPDNVVSAVLEDSRGNLWIGTSGGLCRFANGRFIVETTSDGEAYDQILSLFEDRENNIWVGAKNGLYQLRVQQFTTYTTRHGLAHNNVTSIYEDREGALWIGTWGGGLHHLQNGKITVYSSAKNQTMRNDLILALEGARDGGVWFATDFDGSFYQCKNGQLKRYASEEGFGPTAVRDLLEIPEGLIIGTARESLHILKNGKVSQFADTNALRTKDIRCLLADRDGRIWIGTESGLICKTGETFARFTTNEGLSDPFILSLYEDEEQTLWIGTAKGLNRLPRNANSMLSYGKRQGMFEEPIVEIVEDDAGNLWLATRGGVFRISRQSFDLFDAGQISQIPVRIFGRADGMTSPVCVGVAKPSAIKSRDGRLWFATTKGLAVTDPQLQIAQNETPPPLVIKEVFVDKKPVELSRLKGKGQNFLPVIGSPSSYACGPGKGDLEIRYTALSFAAPEKNRFKYRLVGFDTDWVDAGTRRIAFYNSVPPGSYEFKVIACNNDGVWNTTGSSFKLTLAPHYWQTNWFQGLIAISAIGLVAGAARYGTRRRLHATMQRLEQQHAIERERARIAQDMHDELGARLTEIRVLSDLTEKKKNQPAEVETQTRRISAATGELIRNLHSIVWAVNPANDSLEKLADYICGFAQPFLKGASIRCRLERPDHLPAFKLSAEVRHNVVMAIKEALNNIVKHANASEVQIRLSVDKSMFRITIADDGKGFSVRDKSAEGNGLENMERRMQSIEGRYELSTEPGEGTAIRFEIPLKNASP